MSGEFDRSLCQLFADWRTDDRVLESRLDALRQWMTDETQSGSLHYRDMADRLMPLKAYLGEHFEREFSMLEKLSQSYPDVSQQVEAVRRQTTRDHQTLTTRLEDFIQRLRAASPPFESCSAAIDELELIVDALEQHEEQESESMHILMPRECEVADTQSQ